MIMTYAGDGLFKNDVASFSHDLLFPMNIVRSIDDSILDNSI